MSVASKLFKENNVNLALMSMSSVALNSNPMILFNNPIPIIRNSDPMTEMDSVPALSARLLSETMKSLKAERFGRAEDYLARFRMAS